MDYAVFAQSFGQIRAMETKLLGKPKINALLESASYSDCVVRLRDTGYGKYISASAGREWLKSAIEDLYAKMYRIVPIRCVVDIPAIKYDVHNLKCLIKGKLAVRDLSDMLIDAGTIPKGTLCGLFERNDFGAMPEVLARSADKACTDYKESSDPQDIDIGMDKAMFEYMGAVADQSGMEFLIDYVRFITDTANIRAFIRIRSQRRGIGTLKKSLIPGGKLDVRVFEELFNEPIGRFREKLLYTEYDGWAEEGIGAYMECGDISAVEKFGDNSVLRYLERAKLASMGPEPIIAYIAASEEEIKALRIILTGKRNMVPRGLIAERLRDTYV